MHTSREKVLCLYPESPLGKHGYGLVVRRDHSRIAHWFPNRQDIFYTRDDVPSSIVLRRRGVRDPKRMLRFGFSRYPTVCPTPDELQRILPSPLNRSVVFCGDSCLYPAVKQLFPDSVVYVRLHNVFSTCLMRCIAQRLYRYGPLSIIELIRYLVLELEIFSDPKVVPIFLCREEANFYRALYPDRRAYVAGVFPRGLRAPRLRRVEALVWLGGLSAHKMLSMRVFLDRVLPTLAANDVKIPVHLYGQGTERFAGRSGVTAHGRYPGSDFPYLDTGLYLNPDFVGGGVKIKLLDYLESGVAFISTKVGAQGIPIPKHAQWIVTDSENWAHTISTLVRTLGSENSGMTVT